MARSKQFRTKRVYDARMKGKANKNLEVMAVVGNGDGATFQVTGRDSFYWIRLVNDDNRLTQCFCDVCALSYGDTIFVARAKDEKLSYYEFVRFIQNADGDTTAPPICPKFAQVVYVSENSCQFNTVGAAVTYINALVTGPAATRLFLIKCQAGNFAETGDVTIPQYVHLEGVGEASELEMGANSLILSDDTGISNIVVESSDATDAIRINGKDNVVLRNVRGIQGAAADVFHIYGASTNIELYNCIAEATVANATGFHIGDTAVVRMDRCKAEDATNFADALLLDAALCTTITRWCTFIGSGDDVQTGANSAWYHLDCYFYLTNCTLAAGTHYALPTKRFNQTVIVAKYGGDFQRLGEAVTFINALGDAAAAKRYGILILTGNFAETAAITIPQYVHVAGMGEGSRIEMAGNTLTMSDDSSLQDVVVTHSGGTAIDCVNADCQLFNVKVIVSNEPAYGVDITGDSAAELYHVIVEFTTSGSTYAFHVAGTATPLLWDCKADDTTNINDALSVSDSACIVTTKYCTFHGYGNDVWTGAASTWQHFKCEYDANNSTIGGTETPLRDGAVEIASDAIRGHSNLYPDLGTTTLAQKLGNVYLARCYDVYPDHDEYGLWTRLVNFGVACPDEHWHQGADELAWTGWAAYVGYATPNNIQHDYSQKRVRHNAATRAFYYRAAATDNNIYLRQGVSLWLTTVGAITLHAGVMIDDGVDAGDGNGANNYYRVMVEATALTTNWNVRREYRVGGGAPVVAVTAFSLPPGDLYCPVLVAKQNPDWTNWWAGMYYRRTNARETSIQIDNPPFTWTPARVGLYYYVNGANNGFGLWDWYDETTS